MAGRPTDCTPDLTKKLCSLLELGNYIETACAYVGISAVTYHSWMARARKEIAHRATPRTKPHDNESIFIDFLNAVEKAKALPETAAVSRITQAGQAGDWHADTWYLEHAFPKRWGKRVSEVEMITLDRVLEGLPDDLRAAVSAALADDLPGSGD